MPVRDGCAWQHAAAGKHAALITLCDGSACCACKHADAGAEPCRMPAAVSLANKSEAFVAEPLPIVVQLAPAVEAAGVGAERTDMLDAP